MLTWSVAKNHTRGPGRRAASHVPAALALACAFLLASCGDEKTLPYQGYVEGEFVYVASQMAGRLDELSVARGARVRPGDRLFALENALEVQGVERAEADAQRARDAVNDLKKGLRPEEIEQIMARISQAESDLALARVEMERRAALLASGAVAREEFDQARARFAGARGRLADYRSQLAAGRLGARIDQILAAQRQDKAAQASLEQARWYLEQKIQTALEEAQVVDLLHYKGEWVQPGSPVVKLLPDAGIKARFFIPETDLGKVAVGDRVSVRCDGCPKPYAGVVRFVSAQAEYTPPVIYSQGFRSRLVYMVEAGFDAQTARALKPGQPLDVTPEPGR